MRFFRASETSTPGEETGWLGREDSNLRMAESKSAALPLGYAPPQAVTHGIARLGRRNIVVGSSASNVLAASVSPTPRLPQAQAADYTRALSPAASCAPAAQALRC